MDALLGFFFVAGISFLVCFFLAKGVKQFFKEAMDSRATRDDK